MLQYNHLRLSLVVLPHQKLFPEDHRLLCRHIQFLKHVGFYRFLSLVELLMLIVVFYIDFSIIKFLVFLLLYCVLKPLSVHGTFLRWYF